MWHIKDGKRLKNKKAPAIAPGRTNQIPLTIKLYPMMQFSTFICKKIIWYKNILTYVCSRFQNRNCAFGCYFSPIFRRQIAAGKICRYCFMGTIIAYLYTNYSLWSSV